MSKFDCALCGRDITDDGASFSSYLDSVKESRCPECGGAQGIDVEGLRAEIEGLQTENERLRAEAKRADEEATMLAISDLATTEQVVRALRAENERLRKACALALRVMEQDNRVDLQPHMKFVQITFDREDIAVLREALAEHDEAVVAALVKEHAPENTTKKPLPRR